MKQLKYLIFALMLSATTLQAGPFCCKKSKSSLLAVQKAKSGSFTQISKNCYILELNEADEVFLFSETPGVGERTVSPCVLVDLWCRGAKRRPCDHNAALSFDGVDQMWAFNLTNPCYHKESRTFTYTAEML